MPDPHPTPSVFEPGDLHPDSPHDEPLAEDGADEGNATVLECEFRAHELDGRFGADEVSMREEMIEQMPIADLTVVVDPNDQLPTIIDQKMSTAVSLSRDNLVCVEDDREYVEVFVEDDLYDDLLPREVFRALHLLRAERRLRPGEEEEEDSVRRSNVRIVALGTKWKRDGGQHERRTFKPEVVVTRWGVTWAQTEDGLLRVRPRRERCHFYKRQVMPNDEQPDPSAPYHRIFFRNCTARKSVGGAYLSLRDEGVYACDYREPADPESIARVLDATDNRILNNADTIPVEMVPLFNIRVPESAKPIAEPGGAEGEK